MAKSHREAVLAAACVQTPVHPHSRTPLTLYERLEEDRLRLAGYKEDRSGDTFSSCSDDGDHPCKMMSSKDWVLDVSRLDHTDKEYYMQVERLKNAHVENMEQLEKMYKNKLNLKGVHSGDPVVKSTYRPAWEQRPSQPERPSQPDGFNCSLLKPEFNWNVSSGVSEASFGETSDGEDSCDTQDSTSAKVKILQMWNGFVIQDYIKDTKLDKQKLKRKTDKGKSKEWSHSVTIPEPFEMTVRESKKKEMNAKSKLEIELENALLKKRLEEEAECQKKFRANPVPASVYLPLYHEIMERNEERRRFVKERSKDILLASQKPFQFTEREERKKQYRKMQFFDFEDSVNHYKHFKARPVPKSIYGTSVNERLKEEELYRGIRIHMRSQDLLRTSSYPTTTLACKSSTKSCKAKCSEAVKKPASRPKINTQLPNFPIVHQKNQKRLVKNIKHVTICDPFQLRTDNIPSHREKILKDIEADEECLKETRWPYKSPRSQPRKNSLMVSPHEEAHVVSPRSTESSKRREQAVRKFLEAQLRKEEEEKRIRARKKKREKLLKKHITRKVKSIHPQQAKNSHSKLKELRRNEKQRMEEYFEELDAMKDRVSQTPLLLERVRKENASLCAEKRYSGVLKDAGLPDDYVLTKGQTLQTSGSFKGPGATKEEVNSDDEEGSTQGTLEIEDLHEDGEDHEASANESEEEKQEYSTDEDHTDSDS